MEASATTEAKLGVAQVRLTPDNNSIQAEHAGALTLLVEQDS